ncbi:MAG TPA: serine hydrolase [Ktedonobacterales bacterium]
MSDDPAQDDTDSMSLDARIAALLAPLGEQTAVAARRLTHPPSMSMSPAMDAADRSSQREGGRHRSRAADSVSLRAETPLPMGTLARLAVAVEMLRRVDLGQFGLDEPLLDLAPEDTADVAGEAAATRTLGAVCARMLAEEEPAATAAMAALIELVGLGEINETLSSLKLGATHLAREADSAEAPVWRRVSTTSASDMLTLVGLLSGSAIPNAAWLRATLASQARTPHVRSVLPPEAELAYLSAVRGRECHAAGWLRGPGGGGAFCVLLAGVDDPRRAHDTLVAVVRVLWMAWCAG